MKVIILGSSVAGSAMALALSKFCEVTVYDEKKKEEISEKVCGNICTYSIEKFTNELGIKEDFATSRYNKINVYSKHNMASFPTREYEVSRKKILSEMMKRAQKNGVKFNFSTTLIDLHKRRGNYEVFLEKNKKTFSDKGDVIIGADGAVSTIAKKINRSNKKFFLFLQAKVKSKQMGRKDLIPGKNSYNIFLGRNFGYYAYIFPSKNGKEFKIGLGDDFESDVSEKFKIFSNFLGIKNPKIRGALVPKPCINEGRGNVFLIGDSSCNVKYSAGGIVPILEQVIALRDRILYKEHSKLRRLKGKILFNQQATKFIEKMDDKDFDEMLEIMKDPKFSKAFSSRDDLRREDLMGMMSPKLLLLMGRIALKH